MKKTPSKLRADAASIRENCARMLVHADKLDSEAASLEEQERERAEAQREANACLVRMFFEYRRRLVAVH